MRAWMEGLWRPNGLEHHPRALDLVLKAMAPPPGRPVRHYMAQVFAFIICPSSRKGVRLRPSSHHHPQG